MVPVLIVVLSVIWLLGIMSGVGKGIDIMLTVLPIIMFVVGMSDVVHILNRYLEELREGNDKVAAVKIAFKEVYFQASCFFDGKPLVSKCFRASVLISCIGESISTIFSKAIMKKKPIARL